MDTLNEIGDQGREARADFPALDSPPNPQTFESRCSTVGREHRTDPFLPLALLWDREFESVFLQRRV
jgi:hypothetical protein